MLMRDARQDRRKFFGTVVAGGEGKPPRFGNSEGGEGKPPRLGISRAGEGKPPRLGISRFPNVKSCTKTNKFVAFGPFTYRFYTLEISGKSQPGASYARLSGVCVCAGKGG